MEEDVYERSDSKRLIRFARPQSYASQQPNAALLSVSDICETDISVAPIDTLRPARRGTKRIRSPRGSGTNQGAKNISAGTNCVERMFRNPEPEMFRESPAIISASSGMYTTVPPATWQTQTQTGLERASERPSSRTRLDRVANTSASQTRGLVAR